MSFLLFCYRMRVYKSKRVPLLHFSALCDIFRKKFFFRKFQIFFPKKNVLRFLSLRYCADLRRSRLVLLFSQFYFVFFRIGAPIFAKSLVLEHFHGTSQVGASLNARKALCFKHMLSTSMKISQKNIETPKLFSNLVSKTSKNYL